MLTRKCEQMLGYLLQEGNFNVRVTIVASEVRMNEGAWLEYFRDAIGGGIVNNSNVYFNVNCKTEKSSTVFKCKGNEISQRWKSILKNANSARIDISPIPMSKSQSIYHTWIIVANV